MSGSIPKLLGPGGPVQRSDPADPLPGEKSIETDAGELLEDSTQWLTVPNAQLGGKRPADCIGNVDEQAVRDLLRTMRHVGLS
jgi:hypothetical protein